MFCLKILTFALVLDMSCWSSLTRWFKMLCIELDDEAGMKEKLDHPNSRIEPLWNEELGIWPLRALISKYLDASMEADDIKDFFTDKYRRDNDIGVGAKCCHYTDCVLSFLSC